jgi:hypothetical protein
VATRAATSLRGVLALLAGCMAPGPGPVSVWADYASNHRPLIASEAVVVATPTGLAMEVRVQVPIPELFEDAPYAPSWQQYLSLREDRSGRIVADMVVATTDHGFAGSSPARRSMAYLGADGNLAKADTMLVSLNTLSASDV